MHTPTSEQAIVHKASVDLLSKPRGIIKVVAGAGCGKTTTLVGSASECKKAGGSRLLYLAFSKPLVQAGEASFRNIAAVRTFNAMAYEGTAAGATGRPTTQIYPAQVIDAFGLNDKRLPTQATTFARIILAIVTTYCQSSSVEMGPSHIPYWVKDPVCAGLALKYAEVLFKGLLPGVKTSLPLPHDVIVKSWALRGCPGLSAYDFVFLDEAQDLSGVLFGCLAYAKRACYVGDAAQQIFGFKGAQDAMLKVPGHAFPLSLSFRFGQEIADAANSIIRSKASKAELGLKGLSSHSASIGPFSKQEPHTRIFRTNAGLLAGALTLSDLGASIDIVGDMAELQSKIEGAYALLRGATREIRHPAYQQFRSWDEFEGWMYRNQDSEVSQIGSLVKNNARRVDSLVRLCKAKNPRGLITLITAHRAKGCEWRNVLISNDFDSRLDGLLINGQSMSPKGDEELNLLYVATTRTMFKLESQSESLNDIIR